MYPGGHRLASFPPTLSFVSVFQPRAAIDNHDALFIFSDLLGKPKQNLISQILFFCITGFSHLALITCSIRLEQFKMISTLIPPQKVKVNSKLKVKVLESEITKVLLAINLLPNILKKPPPLRGKIPRLRRPELLLAEEFSSSLAPHHCTKAN